MGLEKITIQPVEADGSTLSNKEIKVLFNPASYTISKTINWSEDQSAGHNAPMISFSGGGSRELSLDLFYDVTERINGAMINDVRIETSKVAVLTRIQRDLARPPLIIVLWDNGANKNYDFPFTGVITSLTQNFTLFSAEGIPLRATLTVKIKEFLDWEKDKKETDPEFTTRIIKRGDSLSSIAAAVYQDPAKWRVIAEANEIEDPRNLTPGVRLNIPKTS